MNIKKRTFDIIFIIVSTAILIALSEYGLLEKYMPFSLIPILIAYQLGQFSERKFNYDKWGTVKNTEVEKLFTDKVKAYFDPRKNCSACLFQRNNQQAKDLINLKNYKEVKFNKNIKHINFP